MKIKLANFKSVPENELFFKELEGHAIQYNQKLMNLNQGLTFYQQFNQRINELGSRITDFLLARDVEKNELIKAITGGYDSNQNNFNNNNFNANNNNNNFNNNINNNYNNTPNRNNSGNTNNRN